MSNKSYSPLHRVSLTAVSIAAASFLSACGGGGSDGTAAATATATDVGTLSIDVTDGPATALDNVYITVKEVWFHHSDSALHADADWKKFPLTTPVTIDMNKLSNGALAKAFDGIKLPVGTYKQIRLFLADSTDPLVDTAKTAGLLFNDQVNYTDPKGVKKSAALELASAEKGIALNGSFDIAKGKTLRLAVEFNVGDDVVRFTHNNADAFKLQPNLRYFDLDNAAAIGGSIDRTACSALANPCRDIIVKLEEPSADGSVHRVTRWTSVKADGSFMLYPVPASKGKTYDMVITGRNAQPMIVKGIPAVGGSTPKAGSVSVSSTALSIKPATDFSVNLASAVNPTGSAVQFYATPSSADKPYELAYARVSGFTGLFARDVPLSGGNLLVANYVAGGSPNFNAVAPVEGAGSYSALFGARYFKRVAATGGVSAPGAGKASSLITPPTMQPETAVSQLGTVTGNLILTKAGAWDRGFVVVSYGGSVVNAASIDAALALNGGVGGSYSVPGLPSGSATKPLPGASYEVSARVWNSKSPEKVKTVPVKTVADLRIASTATANITLP